MTDEKTEATAEEKTVQNMDPNFFKRADTFIKEANDMLSESDVGKVSASLLYAAARFNAYIVASSAADKAEADRNKVEAIEYFTGQYRSMLTANMDDYVEKYDDYMGDK